MNAPDGMDPRALDRLREWGGDDLLGQMIRLFLDNSRDRMEQIRAGVAGDLAEGERGAHSLKSSAANLGAEGVRRIAAELERMAEEGDRSGFAALVPDLERAYADACGTLESIGKEVAS